MEIQFSDKEIELIRSALYTHLRWLERGEFRALAINTSELLAKVSSVIKFDRIA